MKKFFTIISFFCITMQFGLSQRITFGMVNSIDFNLYRFYNSDYLKNRNVVMPDIGWTFSVAALYKLNNNLSFVSAVGVTTKQLVPDINKEDHIFESVHFTSIEIPLRAKYKIYSFGPIKDQPSIDEKKPKKGKKASIKTIKPFDPNGVHLYAIAGVSYSQMLSIVPQYFDDGNIVYEPLEKQKTVYPELGFGLSKNYHGRHTFTLDVIARYSRKPFEFSTTVIEKASLELGYYFKW